MNSQPRGHDGCLESEPGLGVRGHREVPGIENFPTAQAPAGLLNDVRRLLDNSFAEGFSDHDWEHTLGGWHVVVMEADTPLAHAAVVARCLEVDGQPFHTGYVEGVATVPGRQGDGFGSLAMSALMEVLRAHFELGALSTSRYRFYERLGWERWRGPTFVRHGRQLTRTEDEDDGVMVLRFGHSLELELNGSISCQARAGDDW